ncbi:MAG: Uma2 family endonuclease [Chloroflexi bacterium]|nr:Uma2 family endonuclease [Chloroflexota bacterium]
MLTAKIWPGRYDIDDVWEIVHRPENDNRRFELLDGKLVEFPLAGFQHGVLAGEMCFHIYEANKRASLGLATARCGYHPPDDRWTVLGPSAAFTRKERVPYPLAKKYAARMPDLAVEIASFCNPYDWVREKLPKYLLNGTQLVWIVIPDRKGVEVCRLDDKGDIQSEFIGSGGALTGEPVLPGFSLELSALFD